MLYTNSLLFSLSRRFLCKFLKVVFVPQTQEKRIASENIGCSQCTGAEWRSECMFLKAKWDLGQMRFSHCVVDCCCCCYCLVFCLTWHRQPLLFSSPSNSEFVNIAAVVVGFEWRSWYAIVLTPIQLSLISPTLSFLSHSIRKPFYCNAGDVHHKLILRLSFFHSPSDAKICVCMCLNILLDEFWSKRFRSVHTFRRVGLL